MSTVVIARYAGSNGKSLLHKAQYLNLLKSGIQLMAGKADPKLFVKNLFPGGSVGIKVNCLAHANPTPVELTEALAEILTGYANISENDIVIWERTNRELQQAGYRLNASSFGKRCLGTDSAGIGYSSDFYSSGNMSSLVSNILTDMVNHTINASVLKDHSIAGLSGGLKNMFGAVHNPNKFHPDHCDPYAADLNSFEPIRNKHRLSVIDAIRVQYENGPGFNPAYCAYYNGLILSTDPVAADRVGLEILEHLRASNGLPTLADAGRPVHYLESAQRKGIGTSSMDKIDLRVITADDSGVAVIGRLFP